MNMNRLINMGLRILMRKGMNAGIDMAARRGKKPEEMTQAERQNAQKAQQTTHQARRGMNIVRRLMR